MNKPLLPNINSSTKGSNDQNSVDDNNQDYEQDFENEDKQPA